MNQPNIDLRQTKAVKCEKCGNEVFIEGLLLREASRLLTGTAQDALIPITVFACSKCGHVNERFLPLALKEQKNEPQSPSNLIT